MFYAYKPDAAPQLHPGGVGKSFVPAVARLGKRKRSLPIKHSEFHRSPHYPDHNAWCAKALRRQRNRG
jgi:hypothetical protein